MIFRGRNPEAVWMQTHAYADEVYTMWHNQLGGYWIAMPSKYVRNPPT